MQRVKSALHLGGRFDVFNSDAVEVNVQRIRVLTHAETGSF